MHSECCLQCTGRIRISNKNSVNHPLLFVYIWYVSFTLGLIGFCDKNIFNTNEIQNLSKMLGEKCGNSLQKGSVSVFHFSLRCVILLFIQLGVNRTSSINQCQLASFLLKQKHPKNFQQWNWLARVVHLQELKRQTCIDVRLVHINFLKLAAADESQYTVIK